MAKSKKSKKLEIEVQVVPNDGQTEKKKVKVAATGASVAEILKAAGLDAKDRDLKVNGEPAELTRHVGPKDVLKAQERGKPVVAMSERPRGS